MSASASPVQQTVDVDPRYAWMLFARRILAYRTKRLAAAQARAAKAISELVEASDAVDAATDLVVEAITDVVSEEIDW